MSSFDWYTDSWEAIARNYHESLLIAGLLVATSGRTSLKANVALANKAYWQIIESRPLTGFMGMHRRAIVEFCLHGGFHGQKYQNFLSALLGDKDAIVVDMWMSRWHFGHAHRDTVSKGGYSEVEQHVRRISKRLGACPRDTQAWLWCGIRRNKDSYASIMKQMPLPLDVPSVL